MFIHSMYNSLCIFLQCLNFSSIYSGQSVNVADGQSLPFKSEILSHEKCIIRGSIIRVILKEKDILGEQIPLSVFERKWKRKEGKENLLLNLSGNKNYYSLKI